MKYFIIIMSLGLVCTLCLIFRPSLIREIISPLSLWRRMIALPIHMIRIAVRFWRISILPIAAILVGIFTTAAKAALLFLALSQAVSYVKPLVLPDDAKGLESEYVDLTDYETRIEAIETGFYRRDLQLQKLSDRFDYRYTALEQENARLRYELDSIKGSLDMPSGSFDPHSIDDLPIVIPDESGIRANIETDLNYLYDSPLNSSEFAPETIDLFASENYKPLEPTIIDNSKGAENWPFALTNTKPAKQYSPHIKLSWEQILDNFLRFSKDLDVEVKSEVKKSTVTEP